MAASDAEKAMPMAALFNTDQFNQFNLDDTTKVKLKPAKDNNDPVPNLSLTHDYGFYLQGSAEYQ